MKKYFVFIVLTCLLGNRALAQTKSASNTSFTHEVYDFTQFTNNQGTNTSQRTILTGSYAFTEGWSGTKYDIQRSSFTNFESVSVGQIIRVNFTPYSGGTSDGAIKRYNSYNDLPGLGSVTIHSDANNNTYYYEAAIISSNAADEINNNGLTLQAAYMTITSIDVVTVTSSPYTWNGVNLTAVSGTSLPKADRISVSNPSGWNLWNSSENQCSYFQRASEEVRLVNINNLHVGDIVRIWCQGDCRILTDNTATHDTNDPLVWNFNDPDPNYSQENNNGQYPDRNVNAREGVPLKETLQNQNLNPEGNELKIVNDHENGTLVIKLASRWAGILKVEIDAVQNSPRYDYDASLEVYDMYETLSNNGAYTANESADFKLNNNGAYYLKFTNNDLSLNERIAIDKTNTWTFAHGLQASSNWSNLSICNLREGDRVLIYYTGDAPIFSSNGNNGDYTGNAAYKDTWNDGMLDTDEGDHIITKGDPVEYTYCRKEGNFGNEEDYPHIWLYTSYPYVMMENGHLDLALSNGNHTRIVKVKIYSDHQAMMVDDYDNETYTYTAYYNITGELQAKEHIVPGGLEVHVGNDNADQHANVVFSKEGPVSYVKAVDGYKIPGIYRDTNGQIHNNFNLANEAPTTGTYYRFIPEANGQMTIRFKATSLNYYRWDLKADDIYYNTDTGGGWTTEFDRSNEWPMDRSCPYYLMVQDGDSYTSASFKIDDSSNSITGAFNKNNEYVTLTLDVQAGKTYYLYGTWDQQKGNGDDNSIGSTDADLSQRPACGIAELLWVKFNPENKVYPLAKWVPNDTKAVNENNKVPNPDDPSVLEGELATVIGYVGATITVKKMSGNITACRPYIYREKDEQGNYKQEGKLMIDGIQFEQGKNPGGTILIKIGDPDLKTSPLYALTIAYSADPKYNGENGLSGNDGRGHTWDLSTNSLSGMKWEEGLNTEEVKDDNGNTVYDENNNPKIRYIYVKSEAPDYNKTFTSNAEYGGYAMPTSYGTYFADYYANEASIANFTKEEDVWDYFHNLSNGINTGSLLEEEIDYNDHHGISRSDWSFGYNLVYGDKLLDPVFKNKYDMEGDNADMIWDTEGTVIRTSANQSVIFNEFTGDDIHSSEKDPNRYVGIIEGGEFRIPWLMPNDRVIIYMGTGTGRYADEVKFNIRGAYDAVHNEISESDDYIVGGSHWDGADGDKNYRGCYHFFATGDKNNAGKPADMVFKMKEGSLCKIYKIQIYRGDRIITNEIVGTNDENNKFLLWNTEPDPNDAATNAETVQSGTYKWTLKHLGKEQQLANGTGKNTQKNEIIAQTGWYKLGTPVLINNNKVAEGGTSTTSEVESFTYEHDNKEFGTFRMRGKDMEKNMNYVADYADHNVTIAYQQTQPYPYTWDFTDVTGIVDNVTNYFGPEEQLGEGTTAPAGSGLTNGVWNSLDAESYQKTARDLSLWEVFGTAGNYFLRLNSQTSQTPQNLMERDNIFESAKEIGGNQVWANKTIVPEMKGLWFYTENYDPETHKSYDNLQSNGEWIIKQGDADNPGGLEFKKGNCDWFNKIVVPNVPNNAAVYMRMRKLTTTPAKVRYMFGQQVSMSELPKNTTSTSGTTRTTETLYSIGNGDYIVAIMNTTGSKSNLTLSLDGFRVQKLAVSTDPKQIGKTGYTTESRKHQIDHTLTAELTGKPIKAYTATYAGTAAAPDYKTMVLTEISNKTRHNMEAATSSGDFTGCILYNDVTDDDKSVSILDGGFHLFVPDMHDGYGDNTQDVLLVSDDNKPLNVLKSFLPQDNYFTYYTTVSQVTNLGEDHFLLPDEGSDKTLILSARKYKFGTDPTDPANVTELTEVSFVRVDPNGFGGKGAFLNKCSAYIVMPADQMKVLNSTNGAKVNVVFESDLFDMNNGIATGVTTIPAENASDTDTYYTLSGMKINRPTQSGLYIKNGKKVYVK